MVMCMLPLFEGPLLLVLTHIEADELLPALFEAALQLLLVGPTVLADELICPH